MPFFGDRPVLLCTDQSDFSVRLFRPSGLGKELFEEWRYPKQEEGPGPYKPTDAKPVLIEDEVHILIAYHGRVQLVRFADRLLVKDYETYRSCHSAEGLPDGGIVSASSGHGKLRLHRSEDHFVDLDLPYAHGVLWDEKRDCLWAVGDCLYRISIAEDTFQVEEHLELPLDPTGHDLFPQRDGAAFLISNRKALFRFDPELKTFETISTVARIKSASEDGNGSVWVTHPTDLEDADPWHTDTLRCVTPESSEDRYQIPGAHLYKARWF